jgi:DNA-binding Lrp family transcriptional regulator
LAVKAYVLIVTDPGATKGVYDALRSIQGVVELHEVMGPYDIVVEIEVPQLVDVPPILSTQIRTISGIQSTTSLVSFPQ